MILLTFDSTNDAMFAEELLSSHMQVFMMSVPQSIHAGCGFAIRAPYKEIETIKKLLPQTMYNVYKINSGDYTLIENP